MGVLLYTLTSYTEAYTFIASIVLIEVRLACLKSQIRFDHSNFEQEIVAPFTHVGWMISKTGYDLSLPWLVNQVGLLWT